MRGPGPVIDADRVRVLDPVTYSAGDENEMFNAECTRKFGSADALDMWFAAPVNAKAEVDILCTDCGRTLGAHAGIECPLWPSGEEDVA